MTKTIEDLFVYLAQGSDILVIFLFILFIRKCRSEKELWTIAIYCFLFIVINYIADFIFQNLIHFFYSLFTYIEYCAFAYFLWLNIKGRFFRRLILICSCLFIVGLTIYYQTTEFRSIDSVPIGFEFILILLFSFYYLYEQMKGTTNMVIYNKYQFWILTGIMIYLAGSFFIYIFANQVEKDFLKQYWFLTNAFYCIKNIFFCIAIIMHVRKQNKYYHIKLRPTLS
jgi:hypothetical protein